MEERPDEREPFEIKPGESEPLGPGTEEAATTSFDPSRLDFGHYSGHTIEELATQDPDYLRWLERHPSGRRYRSEIHRVLGVTPISTDWRR
jgi:broad specificity phosphatase PhoE